MTQPSARARPQQPSGDQIPARGADVSLLWILAVLLRDRRAIVLFASVGAAISILIALLQWPRYTSTFSFIPQSTLGQGSDGVANLASQFGISVGALRGPSQSPQLYADLLQTREVLSVIASDTVSTGRERVPLSVFLGVAGSDTARVHERTMRVLREKVISSSVATRTTGAVTVRARTESPEVSLQIAERLLEGLNRFNLVTRQSQAREERRFTEERLSAARASLRAAEDALQTFLQSNRQFNAPQLTFQQQRLQREVALQQQVVMALAQQYEDARIREVRDTPVITVLEKPTLPVLPDPRGRLLLLSLGTLGALMLGAAVVLAREGMRRQRGADDGDPSYAMLETEWQRIRRMFGSSRSH